MVKLGSYPLAPFIGLQNSTYRIWCGNLGGRMTRNPAVRPEQQGAVSAVIQRFFYDVLAAQSQGRGTRFTSVSVQWFSCPDIPAVADHELVIYFLPSRADTILNKISRALSISDLGGYTVIPPGPISACEVYTDMGSPNDWGILALHEAMHNKLSMDDGLHARGGGGVALATPAGHWTAQNVALMASHLADRHPQLKEGCRKLADPMSGIV